MGEAGWWWQHQYIVIPGVRSDTHYLQLLYPIPCNTVQLSDGIYNRGSILEWSLREEVVELMDGPKIVSGEFVVSKVKNGWCTMTMVISTMVGDTTVSFSVYITTISNVIGGGWVSFLSHPFIRLWTCHTSSYPS